MNRLFAETLDIARKHKHPEAKHVPGQPSEGESHCKQHAACMVGGKEWATISFKPDHPLYKTDAEGNQIPHVVPAEQLRNDPALHL